MTLDTVGPCGHSWFIMFVADGLSPILRQDICNNHSDKGHVTPWNMDDEKTIPSLTSGPKQVYLWRGIYSHWTTIRILSHPTIIIGNFIPPVDDAHDFLPQLLLVLGRETRGKFGPQPWFAFYILLGQAVSEGIPPHRPRSRLRCLCCILCWGLSRLHIARLFPVAGTPKQ